MGAQVGLSQSGCLDSAAHVPAHMRPAAQRLCWQEGNGCCVQPKLNLGGGEIPFCFSVKSIKRSEGLEATAVQPEMRPAPCRQSIYVALMRNTKKWRSQRRERGRGK